MAAAAGKITSLALESAERLKVLTKPLRSALAFSLGDDAVSYRSDISVSIEERRLSIAQGTVFLSRTRIKGFRVYASEDKYPKPENLVSSAALFVSELKIQGKIALTLSVPKAWAVIRVAEFPSVVRENISRVVSYELDRLTPFSPEESFYDFRVLKEENGKISVMIVAVRADLISPYITALGEKGFGVNRLTVNLSGMESLCRHINRNTCYDYIFLDMGEKEFEGMVFDNGAMIAAFSDTFPASDEKTKTETVINETAPYVKMFSGKGKSPQILALLREKDSVLREMLKLRTGQTLMMLDETDLNIGLQKTGGDIPYAAIGSVVETLRPEADRLNLLARGLREESTQPMTLTAILLIAVVVLWIVYTAAPLRVEEEKLAEIDNQLMLIKDDVKKAEVIKKELETLNKDISIINNFKEKNPMALNIIKELAVVLPKTAWLSRVRITETGVEIEGNSVSTSELLPKLEASKYFEKVDFASPTYKDPRMNSERFSIKMAIEGIEKTDIKTGHPAATADNVPGTGLRNVKK